MAKNLYLDAGTNDLVVYEGQLVMTANKEEELSQKIQNRLLWYRGEWYLNIDGGFPWFENVSVKNPDIRNIRALLAKFILSVAGVEKIISLDLDYQSSARELKVDFVVLSGDTEVKGNLIV